MLKRFFSDIFTSAMILVLIGAAYFTTAQKVLKKRTHGFAYCAHPESLVESIDKLTLRRGLVKHKDLPEHTKSTLVLGYDEQIGIFKEKLEECKKVE